MKTKQMIVLFLLVLTAVFSKAYAAEITKVYKNQDKICTAEIYCSDISELEGAVAKRFFKIGLTTAPFVFSRSNSRNSPELTIK